MTTQMMVDVLEEYCQECHKCDSCELKNLYDEQTDVFTDNNGCVFDEMDEQMVEKIYGRYKELNPTACENAETKCCNKEPNSDMVNHPSHYTQGGIECIDALKAATVSKTGIEAVCTANAIKYLWRYEEKNGIEDVKKARWYIDRLIKELENG